MGDEVLCSTVFERRGLSPEVAEVGVVVVEVGVVEEEELVDAVGGEGVGEELAEIGAVGFEVVGGLGDGDVGAVVVVGEPSATEFGIESVEDDTTREGALVG